MQIEKTLFCKIVGGGVLLAFYIVYVLFHDYIPSYFFSDQLVYQEMIYDGVSGFGVFSSYTSTAYLYSLLPDDFRNEYFLSGIFILSSLVFLCTLRSYFSIFFHVFSSIFLVVYLGQISKDLIVYVSYVVLLLFPERVIKYAFLLWYIFYGIFFRWYYLVVLLMSLFASRFFTLHIYYRVAIAILVLLVIPGGIYHEVYMARMEVNLDRAMYSDVRTLVVSPFVTTDGVTFIANYLYSLVMFLFPIFFGLAIQDLILIVVNGLVVYLMLAVWRRRLCLHSGAVAVFYIFLSHFALLFVFEPDLGSYMRHLLTYSPLILYCYERVSHASD